MIRPPLHAIVWDFDNTLVDTRDRNRSVTRRIVSEITGRDPDEFTLLRSQCAYDLAIHRLQNWQDLYRLEFGMAPDLIRAAGGMWTAYQREDSTPAPWFEGMAEVVRALGDRPQAIVSMNTRGNIDAALREAGLESHFQLIIGCEEVSYQRQKPAPDGLLYCLEVFTELEAGTVLYIGDHPVDAECAANANQELERRRVELRVTAVAAGYGSDAPHEGWPVEPHFRIDAPLEVLTIAGAR